MNPYTSASQAPQFTMANPTTHVNNQTSIREAYHLLGLENYGSRAFRMKNILQRNGLYDFCVTTPSAPILNPESKDR
jgi:hypothetical protein